MIRGDSDAVGGAAASGPLVSIVIPVFQVAPYLERCLDSVLAQSYRPIEVIVVDDGSTDGSAAILAEYNARHDSLRVINQDNRGPGPARNTGIAAARGAYLALVDADDYVSPEFVGAMVEVAERTGADAVVCNFTFQVGGLRLRYPLMSAPTHVAGEEAARRTLQLLQLPPFTWSKLYRRDWYLEHGFAFPAIFYEDLATTAPRLHRARRVALTRQPLYYYCLRSTGITGDFGVRNVVDFLTAVDILRHFVRTQGKWRTWRTEYRRLLRYVGLQLSVQIALQDNTIRWRHRPELIRLTLQHLRSLRDHPVGDAPQPPPIDPLRYPLRRPPRNRTGG